MCSPRHREISAGDLMRVSAPISVALAVVLFALPAAFAAMIAFERLQISQIDRYQAMLIGLGSQEDRAIPPAEIARYVYRLKYAGYPGRPGGTMFYSRVPWTARTKLPIIAAFLPGALLAGTLLCWLSYRPQILPLAASKSERFWAICGAMRAAWLRSVGAAIVVAALAWYLGFDRDGTTGPLEQRLAPRPIQLTCLVAGWCAVSLAASATLLPRSLARIAGSGLAERLLCRHCGYPLHGLGGRNCPECGRPGTTLQWLDDRSRVWTGRGGRRLLLSVTVMAAVLVGATSVSSRARDWLLLRPQPSPSSNGVGWLASGEGPQEWQSGSGVVALSANLRERSDGSGAEWAIFWTFKSHSPPFKPVATSGVFQIPVTHGTSQQDDLHWRELLPCGPIAFYSIPDDPRLHVLSPGVIFNSLGDSSRPIPTP